MNYGGCSKYKKRAGAVLCALPQCSVCLDLGVSSLTSDEESLVADQSSGFRGEQIVRMLDALLDPVAQVPAESMAIIFHFAVNQGRGRQRCRWSQIMHYEICNL